MAWGLAASGQQRRPTAATTQQSGRDSSQISARWHGKSPLAGQPSRELTAACGRGEVEWYGGWLHWASSGASELPLRSNRF